VCEGVDQDSYLYLVSSGLVKLCRIVAFRPAPRQEAQMSRKAFVESVGATCRNWRWSWSFVNEDERFVLFGAWAFHTDGDTSLILGDDWERNAEGRRQAAFGESVEHLRLVTHGGYRLFTYPIESSDEKVHRPGGERPTISGFTPQARERALRQRSDGWYAEEGAFDHALPDEVCASGSYSEGATVTVTINAVERSGRARAACVAHHGYSCAVCSFNFKDRYGEIGSQYIHVHHVVPLSEVHGEHDVDPVADLVPICPNCHAMIHRTRPGLTVEQLRAHIQ
jgi:5-methylcytosine-specific restriction protein A